MTISRINNLILAAIILVNGYVIGTPFVPAILYAVNSHHGQQAVLSRRIHATAPQPTATNTAKPASQQSNNLIIPAMLLDQPIYEGRDTYAVLNKGILRAPVSSTPDKGGNTVLLGHRFTYTVPKGVFYYLDKLQIGDEIGLAWNGQQYLYKVSETKVISPTEVSIQNPTADARLTLYTCTPLAWPKDRLVVVAKLQGQQP